MLTKRNLIVLVFVVSVVGLFVVQYQYLRVGLGLARVQFSNKIDGTRTNIAKELSEFNSLTFTLGNTIRKDTSAVKFGLDSLQRASQYYLNDYIAYQLGVSGIDAPFSYALFSRDSIQYLGSARQHLKGEGTLRFPIKLEGYLPELLRKEVILELGFQDLNRYFVRQLWGLILPGGLFLLAIIVVVIWVLRSFYLQRGLITTTNEFINNLTHELKTPVFSIGLASKILEKSASGDQRPVVELIRKETRRLGTHIDKVLELGSLESGRKLMRLSELDFRPRLLELCEGYGLLARHEALDFDFELEQGPFYIRGETYHLENVIGNLLENARKYSERPVIRLKATTDNGWLRLAISDNGQGIARGDLKNIFKKYYRAKNGDLHKVKGYGLGLSYVQKIVRLHRGKIAVTSKLGVGTTFVLSLKLTKNGKKI